jgi:hypothetical protein
MKATDIFPSKYLRAADLGGHEPIVTIDRVKLETLGDDSKPVLYFSGKDKGLVLNKTNWAAIVDITKEEDSDLWTGHKVKLFTARVDFQGKRVDAVRVDAPPNGRPAPPRPVEHIDDDQIPF